MPLDVPLSQAAELQRMRTDDDRSENWKRWGPYLSERQWGTVREDYSAEGDSWGYFPFDHAASRAYRWGEDGLLGFCDRQCRLCFALSLWNGRDPILKERLFGLTNPQGNHGEDVKEVYFYLDSTPTHSYCKGLYKYPQTAFPYQQLITENAKRDREQPEFELADTGIFNDNRYFDVQVEYAKKSPNDILIRIRVSNRGPDSATLELLPTIWFRNSWSWGCDHDGCEVKPRIERAGATTLKLTQATLGPFQFAFDIDAAGNPPTILLTENETNAPRLFGSKGMTGPFKDAFVDAVVGSRAKAATERNNGTKAAGWYRLKIAAGAEIEIRGRLFSEDEAPEKPFGPKFDRVFADRINEADGFYAVRMPAGAAGDQEATIRQAYAGLLWSKQFYHYVVKSWLDGDPDQPKPPAGRKTGRNSDWPHFFARDVLSMPDKWEYPWFAAWDTAFHMLPFSRIDPQFAKEQLILFLREWYMHPNGKLPAYEWSFDDVNPPVHAWACWRVYKMTGVRGQRDRMFLSRVFKKLLINFTWWVNRKDIAGNNLFSGGFLGMDNIGVFDRSRPLPTGGYLEQADGTAWMAFFCSTMLSMALELAQDDPSYEDIASKFFEHFVAIADAMNTFGGAGLWDDEDGFYYDQLRINDLSIPLKVRSLVGVVPLFGSTVIEAKQLEKLPGFRKRTKWFFDHRPDLLNQISFTHDGDKGDGRWLLAIASADRLARVLKYVLDETEFLSPFGIRSLSMTHRRQPYVFRVGNEEHRVDYIPGESNSGLFGGNSNWRGPIWFPLNFLLLEALEKYQHYCGDDFLVEFPTGSDYRLTLRQVTWELAGRLSCLFAPDSNGRRPCHGDDVKFKDDPHWKDLLLFHEYFDADTGRGLGASHQTGWTALVALLLEDCCKSQTTLY